MDAKQAYEVLKKYKQHENALQYCGGFIPLYEEIMKHVPASKRTLDIGCAYGMLSLMLADRGDKVVGADMTKQFTSMSMFKDHGIEFETVNLEKDPVPGGFDLIMLTEVLEHLNSNPLPTIKKLYDSLNKGGAIVCTTPDKAIWGETTSMNDGRVKGLWNDLETWREIPEYKGKWKDQHTFHYDQFELVSLFSEAGFAIEKVETILKFSHILVGRKL